MRPDLLALISGYRSRFTRSFIPQAIQTSGNISHELHRLLRQYWGYDTFRPLQQDIMESVIAGRDTLALLPTGGGKSLCYQVPALLMDGVCLVVSPLVALMEDQVSRLKSIGINAATIPAGMKWPTVRRLLEEVLQGAYKLLYISPERLQSRIFQEYLPAIPFSLIAVDEAHCVSQWGHDFRPEYLQISDLRREHARVPVLALTASATTAVAEDIGLQLKMSGTAVFRQSFDRPNIQYNIRYSEDKEAHILEALQQVPGSAIIYCRSRRNTESLSRFLVAKGWRAQAYHAGMSRGQREEVQYAWMRNETRIVTATTAFGMGIDKADVSLVIHYDAPEQLESYYQEAGRAGRNGAPAAALTLYNNKDLLWQAERIGLQYPAESYLREVYQAVNEYLQVPIGVEPQQYFPFELTDFCRKFRLDALPATYALRLLEREGLWTISDAVFQPATIRFTASRHEVDNLNQHYPELGAVCIALLRLYNGIFQYPVAARPFAVAKKLKARTEDVAQALQKLHRMGIIDYQPAIDGPQLFFHHYRVDSRHLHIDRERIRRLKKRQEERTAAMRAFLEETEECRSRIMLRYFGEEATGDCGHCDVCTGRRVRGSWNEADARHAIIAILSNPGTITVQALTSRFPHASRQALLQLIRRMVDEGGLGWQQDNTIIINRRS